MIVLSDPVDRMIAAALIDALDEAGYLTDAARGRCRSASARRSAGRSGSRPPPGA